MKRLKKYLLNNFKLKRTLTLSAFVTYFFSESPGHKISNWEKKTFFSSKISAFIHSYFF